MISLTYDPGNWTQKTRVVRRNQEDHCNHGPQGICIERNQASRSFLWIIYGRESCDDTVAGTEQTRASNQNRAPADPINDEQSCDALCNRASIREMPTNVRANVQLLAQLRSTGL